MRRLAAIAAILLLGFSTPRAAPDLRQPTVVLISMDTTRADALSSYGTPPGIDRELGEVTPNLDLLAAEGTRFEQAWAHAPTTLSSHASMLAGLDPHGHAVVRNGFALSDEHDLLAERFRDHGYDTIGVVGAAALERSMGLARGFRLYDDSLESKFGPMVQDRGDRVLERTLAVLDKRDETKPLFLFTHFYDAHAPYGAPGEAQFRFVDPAYDGPLIETRYDIRPVKRALIDKVGDPAAIDAVASLYLGEVAFVDQQIGALLHDLRRRGLLEDAIVVVTADHGEVLHEYPLFAYSHGHDVFAESLHVPLIVWASGRSLPRGRVVKRQIELSGLAPTVERLAGWAPSLGDRRDFADLLALGPVDDSQGWPERPTRTFFTEATRAKVDDPGWNNLGLMRSVHAGGMQVRGWPSQNKPMRVLASQDREAEEKKLEPTLIELLERWDAAAPPHREESMSAATRDALKALGYLED